MTEITFVDGIPICEMNGHTMIVKLVSEPKPFLYERLEVCSVCGIRRKYQKYKYMPEQEVT